MGSRIAYVLAVTIALAFVVVGCGGDDNGDDSAEGGEGSDFRVAFLLPGAVTDQTYNADGQRTAQQIEDELGAEVAITESVLVPDQVDVSRQFATQGYDLIIAWGGQFSDGALAAAEEFPDTMFLVVNSNVENGSNLASMDTAIEQWQFFAGFVAANLSKSGTVAWIGGQCFPATAANLHGTEQGAEYVDPEIKFLSRFTGDFEDPTKAKQAAEALIDQGADVLTANLNNGYAGIYEAAREAGNLPVITEWADNSDEAPEIIASSVLKSQARFTTELAELAQNGELQGKAYFYELPPDWGDVISDTELLPDAVFDEAIQAQEQVANGEIKVKHDETCPE